MTLWPPAQAPHFPPCRRQPPAARGPGGRGEIGHGVAEPWPWGPSTHRTCCSVVTCTTRPDSGPGDGQGSPSRQSGRQSFAGKTPEPSAASGRVNRNPKTSQRRWMASPGLLGNADRHREGSLSPEGTVQMAARAWPPDPRVTHTPHPRNETISCWRSRPRSPQQR